MGQRGQSAWGARGRERCAKWSLESPRVNWLMLPVLGPSTVRDTTALPLDWQASPSQYFSDPGTRSGMTVLNATETRAGLLKATDALKQASLDPYSFVRDGWLQKRENDVYDGNPPADFDYNDPDVYDQP